MKKVTKKERKRQGRNAFVRNILANGRSFTLGNELYVRGLPQTGSKGYMVEMPIVRVSYGTS